MWLHLELSVEKLTWEGLLVMLSRGKKKASCRQIIEYLCKEESYAFLCVEIYVRKCLVERYTVIVTSCHQ